MRVESGLVGKRLHRRTGADLAIVTNRPSGDHCTGNRAEDGADDGAKKCPDDLRVDMRHVSLDAISRRVSLMRWSTLVIIAQSTPKGREVSNQSRGGDQTPSALATGEIGRASCREGV